MSDERPYVGHVAGKSFVDNSVTRQAVKIMKQSITGSWPTFSSIPPQDREVMWSRFEAYFSWPPEETSQIREAWESTLMRRLTQIWSNARKEALKKVNSTNLADTRGHGPIWLAPTYWDGMIIHWLSEDWQKASKTTASNRATLKEDEIVRHSGGSIPFASHEERMERELSRPPTKTEVFLRTHTRKGSTQYVDSRSRAVAEKYDSLISEKCGAGTNSTQQPFDQALWLEASGGLTKGNVYGFGGRAQSKSTSSSSGSSSSAGAGRHSSGSQSSTEYVTRDEFMVLYRQAREAERAAKAGASGSEQPGTLAIVHEQSDDDDDE